jgi:hypothetical protein
MTASTAQGANARRPRPGSNALTPLILLSPFPFPPSPLPPRIMRVCGGDKFASSLFKVGFLKSSVGWFVKDVRRILTGATVATDGSRWLDAEVREECGEHGPPPHPSPPHQRSPHSPRLSSARRLRRQAHAALLPPPLCPRPSPHPQLRLLDVTPLRRQRGRVRENHPHVRARG